MTRDEALKSYPVFTVNMGKVEAGAPIRLHELASGTIPAIVVGSGGLQATIPVQDPIGDRLTAAAIGSTALGYPKLIAKEKESDREYVILVMPTGIGERGRNTHTGDADYWQCTDPSCGATGRQISRPGYCPKCGQPPCKPGDSYGPTQRYKALPGLILAYGCSVDCMGEADQLVLFLRRGEVVRTAYTGRLFSEPKEHFYVWTGEKVLAMTLDERIAFTAV